MTHFRHVRDRRERNARRRGSASAQTTVITREPVETRTVVTTQPLALTPVQRHTIYRTIVREPRANRRQPTVEYRVGTRVPQGARLYDGAGGRRRRSAGDRPTSTCW